MVHNRIQKSVPLEQTLKMKNPVRSVILFRSSDLRRVYILTGGRSIYV